MTQEDCCPASRSKTLVGQRRKQWQKHRVSLAPLKRQNSFVHVVGSHAQCAGISCWYCQRGISTIIAAPYAPLLSAQKWIPTVGIFTHSSPVSSPDTEVPRQTGRYCVPQLALPYWQGNQPCAAPGHGTTGVNAAAAVVPADTTLLSQGYAGSPVRRQRALPRGVRAAPGFRLGASRPVCTVGLP